MSRRFFPVSKTDQHGALLISFGGGLFDVYGTQSCLLAACPCHVHVGTEQHPTPSMLWGAALLLWGAQSSAGKGVWGPTPRDGIRDGGDMGLCHLQSSAPPHPYHCPPPHSVQSCLQQLALLYCGGCNTDASSKACSSASPSLGIIQPPWTPPFPLYPAV